MIVDPYVDAFRGRQKCHQPAAVALVALIVWIAVASKRALT